MTLRIIHALLRWILGVFTPGSGRRRAGAHPAGPTPALRTDEPPTATSWPPLPRSPYGLDAPLDGDASALVRPYLIATERERARQRRRSVALVLAADFGIDVDRHLIGAEGVV
jgi:hypothetical protein